MEWEKIRQKAEEKKAREAQSKMEGVVTELSDGRELSDIYLRHPANESSSDSEGEEASPAGEKDYDYFFLFITET